MEAYTGFDGDDSNMNFDFFQFEEDENIHQDMSSITQVCVDHHGDEEHSNIDVDSVTNINNLNGAVDLLQTDSSSDDVHAPHHHEHQIHNNTATKQVKLEQDTPDASHDG